MDPCIRAECCGNVLVRKESLTVDVLVAGLKRVRGRCVFNYVGMCEPGLVALVHVPEDPCEVHGRRGHFAYAEITRVTVDEALQRTGLFTRFVRRMSEACARIGRSLVIGCVTGRMARILRDRPALWRKLRSDPTSYAYLPSILLTDPEKHF